MPDVSIDLDFNEAPVIAGFGEVNKNLETMQKHLETVKKAGKDVLGESGKSANEYTEILDDAIGKTVDMADKQKNLKGRNIELSAAIKDNVRGLTIMGVNVGDVTDKLQSKIGMLKGVVNGLRSSTGALKIFKIALASTGIGLLLIALGGLVAFFTRTEKGVETVERVMAGLGATVNVLIDRFSSFGEGIVKLFSGDMSGAVDSFKSSVKGIGAEISQEFSEGMRLEGAFQDLEDENRDLSLEFEKQKTKIQELREVSGDYEESTKRRIAAGREALRLEGDLAEKQVKQIEKELGLLKQKNEQSKAGERDESKLAEKDLENEIARIRRENSSREKSERREIQRILKQAAAEAARIAKEQKEAEEARKKAFKDATAELQKRIETEQLAALGDEERLEQQQRFAQRELDLFRQSVMEKAKEAKASEEQLLALDEQFATLSLQLEDRFQTEITEVRKKKRIEREEAERRAIEAKKALDDKEIQDGLTKIEQQKAIGEAEVELLEANASDVLTLEQRKEVERLKIQQEAMIQQRSLLAARFGNDSPEVKLLDLQIKAIGRKIEDYENISTNPILKLKEKILSALKISEEELDLFVSQVGNLFNAIAEANTANLEIEIAKQDEAIAKIDERIAKQQEAFELEQERAEKGDANNLDREKAKLEALEAERAKADAKREAARKKLEEIQAKAQRRQAFANAAAQFSNLALAGSELLAAHASIPFVGVALAIGFFATLLSAFTAFKKSAAGLSEPPKFRKGGSVKGPTHEQGGVMAELEGDEFVVRKDIAQGQKDFLEAFNRGDYRNLDLSELAKQATDPTHGMVSRMTNDKAKLTETKIVREREVIREAIGTDLTGLRGDIKNLHRMIAEKPDYIPVTEGGYIEKKETSSVKSSKRVRIN